MFQQKATENFRERFACHAVICEHENLSLRAPGQMFQALEVPTNKEDIVEIDALALAKIIQLAASTIDLDVVRKHPDCGKNRTKAINQLQWKATFKIISDSEEKNGWAFVD